MIYHVTTQIYIPKPMFFKRWGRIFQLLNNELNLIKLKSILGDNNNDDDDSNDDDNDGDDYDDDVDDDDSDDDGNYDSIQLQR